MEHLDNHSNNTLKTLYVVQWLVNLALEKGVEVNEITEFVMKGDDDAYFNVPSLMNELQHFKYWLEINK